MPPATRGKKVDYKPIQAESEDENEEDEQPKAKRSKTSNKDSSFVVSEKKPKKSGTKAPSRPRSGKLRNLMLMPVDIFVEICQYLHPKDLRALSLTAHSLRKILMSRDSKHVWRSCLLQVSGLPECPPDLNEPQYARLLFSTECYGCGTHCGLSDYYHRVLFCDRCFQTCMVTSKYVYNHGRMANDVMWLFSSGNVDNPCRTGKRQRLVWHTESFDLVNAEYQRLLTSPELLAKFVSDARNTHSMRTTTGTAITSWMRSQFLAKRTVQEVLKDEHQRRVEEKLLLLGWQKDDFPLYQTSYNSLVRKPKPLTEKVWQTLMPKLEPLLEEGKRARLANEAAKRQSVRRSDLQQRYRDLMQDEFDSQVAVDGSYGDLPSAYKLDQVPGIQSLEEDDSNPVITDDLWSTVVEDVRIWVLKYRWRQLNTLVRILDGAAKLEGGSVLGEPETAEELSRAAAAMRDRLSLATSAFRCNSCRSVHWSPGIFDHHRTSHGSYIKLEDKVERAPQELISVVLRNLSKDPELATRDQLATYGRAFLCTRCDERTTPYQTIEDFLKHHLDAERWYSCAKQAVKNTELAELRDTHNWACEEPLVRVDDEAQRQIMEELQREFGVTEQVPVEDLPDVNVARRTCALCPSGYAPYWTSWARLKIHIETIHGKTPDLQAHSVTHWFSHAISCPIL